MLLSPPRTCTFLALALLSSAVLVPLARADGPAGDRLLADGVVALEAGKATEAVEKLEAALATYGPKPKPDDLADHALYFLGLAHERTGAPEKAAEVYARLLKKHGDSLRSAQTREARAEALWKAGKKKKGLALLREVRKAAKGWRERARLDLTLARRERALGKKKTAAASFRALWLRYPASAQAAEARAALDELEKAGVKVKALSLAEEKKRARRLVDARAGDKARAAIDALRKRMKADGVSKAEKRALHELDYLALRSNFDSRRSKKVIALGKKLLKPKKGQPRLGKEREGNAIWMLGRSYSRAGNYDEAVRWYERLSKDHPKHEEVESARFFSAWLPYEGGDYETSLNRFESLAKKLGAKRPRPEDTDWFLGWNRYRLGRYAEAAEAFGASVGRHGGDAGDRVRYWQARSLEKAAGKGATPDIVRAVYRDLAEEKPFSYYGVLSRRRAGVSPPERPEVKPLPPLELPERANVHLRRAKRLVDVDMPLTAQLEITGAPAPARGDVKGAVMQCRLYQAAGDFRAARRVAYPNRAKAGLDSHLRRCLYPAAFPDEVAAEARRNKIPEGLVWAIMFTESRFQVNARSPAGARGLMQLMPATGRLMAKEVGLRGFETARLYEPAVNIRLGTGYLANLVAHFRGQLPLSIGAYNGGPHRVNRWLGQRAELPLDEFVEEVPFRETRNYIKKVLSRAARYEWLYGSEQSGVIAAGLRWKLERPTDEIKF